MRLTGSLRPLFDHQRDLFWQMLDIVSDQEPDGLPLEAWVEAIRGVSPWMSGRGSLFLGRIWTRLASAHAKFTPVQARLLHSMADLYIRGGDPEAAVTCGEVIGLALARPEHLGALLAQAADTLTEAQHEVRERAIRLYRDAAAMARFAPAKSKDEARAVANTVARWWVVGVQGRGGQEHPTGAAARELLKDSVGLLRDVMRFVSGPEVHSLVRALVLLVDDAPVQVVGLLVLLVSPDRGLLRGDPLLAFPLSQLVQQIYAKHRRLLDEREVREHMDTLLNALIDANDQGAILLALEER